MTRQSKLMIALGLVLGLWIFSRTKAGQSVTESLTARLASLLHGEEGLRLSVYQDQAGVWTVGYGHRVLPGDRLYPYTAQKSITQQQAEAWRDADMAGALGTVAQYVHVSLTSEQRLALASLAYNIGSTAFAGSTLVRLLNQGDYEGAAEQFAVWNKITVNGAKQTDPVLVARRVRETSLFRSA